MTHPTEIRFQRIKVKMTQTEMDKIQQNLNREQALFQQ
jgi:hypothetical protein